MSHEQVDDSAATNSPGRVLIRILFWVAGLVLLGALLLPVVHRDISGARHRIKCKGNLTQIGVALHNYHDAFGVFPPAYISDEHGRPMHSWRVLILPYFDSDLGIALHKEYNFSEPWDGPNNIKLLERRPDVYACPARIDDEPTLTSYAAIVGDECVFRGTEPVSISEITDGVSNTSIVGEVAHAHIRWTEPRDISFGAFPGIGQPEGFSSDHEGGVHLLRGDTSAKFTSARLTPKELRAWFTRNGGEGFLNEP